MKVKVSGTCSIFVLGIDMNCPLCGKLVRSGETPHGCVREEPKKLRPPRKKKPQSI
jgi:hypothetical protein